MDSFIAGASKTQEDILQVFIIKIEMCKDNGGRNSKRNKNKQQLAVKIQITTEIQMTTEVSTRSYNTTPQGTNTD